MAVASGMAPAGNLTQESVAAHEFLVVDANGKVRAAMNVTRRGR